MIDIDTQNKLVQLTTNEIANIYKLYGKDYFALTPKEREMTIEIFQAGVGFIEKLKKDFIDKAIVEVTKKDTEDIPF